MRTAYDSIKCVNQEEVVEEYEHIRKTIMEYRNQSKETRKQAGEVVGMGEKAYRLRETGDAMFALWQMIALMKYYNIPAEELFRSKPYQIGKSESHSRIAFQQTGRAARHSVKKED